MLVLFRRIVFCIFIGSLAGLFLFHIDHSVSIHLDYLCLFGLDLRTIVLVDQSDCGTFCLFVDRMGRIDPITPAEPLSACMLFELYLSLLFFCFYIREKYFRHLWATFLFFFLFSASMLIERIS